MRTKEQEIVPKTERIQVRLHLRLYQLVEEIAKIKHTTISEYVAECIKYKLKVADGDILRVANSNLIERENQKWLS